jgi:hypothetical protein
LSVQVWPLAGESRDLWKCFHEIQDHIDTQARARLYLVTLIGKVDSEQEKVEQLLEGVLSGGPIDREQLEAALKHTRNARQYTARLGREFKGAEKNAISLGAMVRIFKTALKRLGL